MADESQKVNKNGRPTLVLKRERWSHLFEQLKAYL